MGAPPCANWRDDLRVVPCFRRDCAVCEEQVKRESVLRSSAEAGQGRLCRESRTTRRSSLQVVDGRCRAQCAMGAPPCANWRDDLRVVPCFRRDCAVCEEQVRRESVLRSSVEAGQGRLRRESRTTRRSSLQVVDGRFALCYWLGMILGASSAMADSMRAVVVWRSLPPATKPSSTGALTIT